MEIKMGDATKLLFLSRARLKEILKVLYKDGLEEALKLHHSLLCKMEAITVGEVDLDDELYHELNQYEHLLDFVEAILNDNGAGL